MRCCGCLAPAHPTPPAWSGDTLAGVRRGVFQEAGVSAFRARAFDSPNTPGLYWPRPLGKRLIRVHDE